MGAGSYFWFHHFLFIIHGLDGIENNRISIQHFRCLNITLCYVKNLGVSTKAVWEIGEWIFQNSLRLLFSYKTTAGHLLSGGENFSVSSSSSV